MPNTYVALYTANLSGLSSASFTSIPQGYTDLVLVFNGQDSATSASGFSIGINNTFSGGLYSNTVVEGNGSAAYSNRAASQNGIGITVSGGTNLPGNAIINFQNYSSTTTFKTILTRYNASNFVVGAKVDLFRSTSAITRLDFFPYTANWATGTTLSIYGIANADQRAKATGGIIMEDSTHWYHTFMGSGAFVPRQSLTCDVLVVAGGGSGGGQYAGGGGAGGVVYDGARSLSAISYNVTIGGGGAAISSSAANGNTGTNSSFDTLVANGGGGGGSWNSTGANGLTGGSGGGGSMGTSTGNTTSGGAANQGTSTGDIGYGSNGGGGLRSSTQFLGGGGGGAGAVGVAAATNAAGNGGAGISTYSSWFIPTGVGVNGFIAGGGGGGAEGTSATNGTGGAGGGGAGGLFPVSPTGIAGVINTGSGGGGYAANAAGLSGAGGSGVVIVRYAK